MRVTAAEFSCLRPASDPANTAAADAAAAVAAMGLARDLLSGHAAILAPPLIVLSTASVGPDNRIRPGPYRDGWS